MQRDEYRILNPASKHGTDSRRCTQQQAAMHATGSATHCTILKVVYATMMEPMSLTDRRDNWLQAAAPAPRVTQQTRREGNFRL